MDPDETRADRPRPPRWRALSIWALAALALVVFVWWSMSAPSPRPPTSEDAIVTTCAAERQRCRMGGGKLGLCAALPDGALHCISQH